MECLESLSVIFKSTMKRFKQIFTFLSQHRKTEHATKSLRSFLNISVCLHVRSATIKLIWTKPCFTRVCVCASVFTCANLLSSGCVYYHPSVCLLVTHQPPSHTHSALTKVCVCVCVSLLGNRGGTREEEGGSGQAALTLHRLRPLILFLIHPCWRCLCRPPPVSTQSAPGTALRPQIAYSNIQRAVHLALAVTDLLLESSRFWDDTQMLTEQQTQHLNIGLN